MVSLKPLKTCHDSVGPEYSDVFWIWFWNPRDKEDKFRQKIHGQFYREHRFITILRFQRNSLYRHQKALIFSVLSLKEEDWTFLEALVFGKQFCWLKLSITLSNYPQPAADKKRFCFCRNCERTREGQELVESLERVAYCPMHVWFLDTWEKNPALRS